MQFHVLFSVVLLLHITTAEVYNVTPDDGDFIDYNETESAKSLEYYLKNTSKYFYSDSQLHFKMGHHHLKTDLVIQNITNVTLTGEFEGLCIIRCTSHVRIIIFNVTDFRLENITFENCSANYSNYLHDDFKYHYASISNLKPSSNASILLYNCMSVRINNIALMLSESNDGFLVVNVRSYSKITNIHIIVQTSSLQTHGILFYYDNWKNPKKISSEIQLDNFQFTTNGSCAHPTYYAITSLLLQNNTNVSVVIQNTIFTNLINVTALYYHGDTCGIDVNNNLTLRNCVVSDNIGYSSLKMFCITLHKIRCTALFITRKQLYYLQQYHTISFINCIFESNHNMTSMIYVSPVSSRATTGYFYLERITFHNNTNTHFIIMKSDIENFWQLSNYFEISESNITANVHDKGQDLMIYINSWVFFNGSNLIMDNYFYTNIGNFHRSVITVGNNITITNNTARQIMRATFIILWKNSTINISRNTVYILLKPVLAYSMISEPICLTQFYSDLPVINASEILNHDHIIMSNNILMISKYLPNDYYNCRWLVGSVFQNAGLQPEFVYGKLLQFENNTVISKDVKRPVSSSICQCLTPSPLSGAQYNINCSSSHLGSIFPGQTLKVEFMVDKQWRHQSFSTTTIVVHNTEDDDCSVVDTFQLSQTHFNHECNNYSYTLWPKNESINLCRLFIGLQNMPEMFYVEFKPCPLGFTYQENSKSCYCDPVLSKNEVISIKSCNLSDETILRPAYSWISAKRDVNTNNTSYIVSSYCPFERCLPYQSNLDLSNPDSQCQFSRTGLLCGKCQQGLSTVFGSRQCKRCSNMYILYIIPILIAGVVFVTLLYIFNLTVRNGTVNTCIFYINILNINSIMLFPNCNFRFTSCFYNGMDDYVKTWLDLTSSLYLIIIAIAFIILSRYSITVQRFTARKALPVLATLFLLTYTKILVTICNVLFRYSTVTHLPSNKSELVWSISPTTPLFGLKFLALFIVCIILFLILLPFNLILLFTRKLSCLGLITTFKPILDNYFGPYIDSAYYWTGLLLLIRGIVYVLLVLDEDLRLIVISLIFGGLLCIHAAVQPFKSKFNNIQECITILNLLAVHSVLPYKNSVGLKITNVLITVGVIYFTLAIVFHCCMCCRNMIHERTKWLFHKINKVKSIKCLCDKLYKAQVPQADENVGQPEMACNYQEFQEPLIALETNN